MNIWGIMGICFGVATISSFIGFIFGASLRIAKKTDSKEK